MKIRPWGSMNWVLSLSTPKPWHLAGVLGTEERSLTCWKHLKKLGVLNSEFLVKIDDAPSEKYDKQITESYNLRLEEFIQAGGKLECVQTIHLMAELFAIIQISQRVESFGENIILDVTSSPKRFFFPLLRHLVQSDKVKNLIVTYTCPESYTENGPLYENIEPWRVLPGFGGANMPEDLWIVSVGFLIESLRQYIGDNPSKKMQFFIPFPAPLSIIKRTWESVASLEGLHGEQRFEKFRVETLDVSSAFDRIRSLAGMPEKRLAFAPFGPKPTSVAMCLYALQKNSSVHYPQPTIYHPNYTQGIRANDSDKAVHAYWIKHDGENLYAV